MTNDTIGVDISKDHLDAHRMSDGASRCFANDGVGHTAFVKWLDDTGLRIVYEPTGQHAYAWIASDLNPHGAVGEAQKASAEKGRLTAEHQVTHMIELLREVERHALPVDRS
jgi:creatinine amidohydrolase/Fe(II)-dependent formamide hydrolase-like protein